MTKLIQMLTHVECVPGPLKSTKTVTDYGAFEELAKHPMVNAKINTDWAFHERGIRRWFVVTDGNNEMVVESFAAPKLVVVR